MRQEHTKPNAPIDPPQSKENDASPASQDATLQPSDTGSKERAAWVTAHDPELTTGQELSVIWRQSGKVLHESLVTPLFGGGKGEKGGDGKKSKLSKGEEASSQKNVTMWRVISLVGPSSG